MSRIAWFDCSAGASGDMLLGALIDVGAPLQRLERLFAELGIGAYVSLMLSDVRRGGFQARHLDVAIAPGAPSWRVEALEQALKSSTLAAAAARRATTDLARLVAIEERLHGKAGELDELGSLDTVVDVVGFHWACDELGIDAIATSAVNVGMGHVRFSHGLTAVPTPATAELLRGIPVVAYGDGEATTPTGALLVSGEGVIHGPLPAMRIEGIGYAAGSRETPTPNIVRCVLGTTEAQAAQGDRVVVLETNVDDMDPRLYETLGDRLFGQGALDVTLTSVIGKHGRPATSVSVIAPPDREADLATALFAESTTLGVRVTEVRRLVLPRRFERIETTLGPVSVKVATLPSGIERRTAEFRDVVARAREHDIPVAEAARRISAEVERAR